MQGHRQPSPAAPQAAQAVHKLAQGDVLRFPEPDGVITGGSPGQAAGMAVDGPAGIEGMGKGINIGSRRRPLGFEEFQRAGNILSSRERPNDFPAIQAEIRTVPVRKEVGWAAGRLLKPE